MGIRRDGLLARRAMLQGGLAGFAGLMGRGLMGCSTSSGDAPAAQTPTLPPGGDEFAFVPMTRPKLVSRIAEIGPLGAPDALGVRVAAGFTARVVAETGKAPVPGKPYVWHTAPDGGATFPAPDGGWIYVSNSEVPFVGGVGALRFDASGALVDAYRILDKTQANCAGGPSPWGTWLSCEEIPKGVVHECDPRGERPAVVRPALGTFRHEAVAFDPVRHHVYLTEDEPDGALYRFTPLGLNKHGFANLAEGALEVAVVATDGAVSWKRVPEPSFTGDVATRAQVPDATKFDGGEGIWWHEGVLYFTTKGDNRVWALDTAAQRMSTLYDAAKQTDALLTGVDNVTVSCCGDVLVAEDGGDMQVVAILPSGQAKALLQVTGHDKSEITGPAFDPSGTRLYFSSQRGVGNNGVGITYEVSGPFHAPG
ncbi:MAG: DUF839 domain-containing protein [Polyangiaceae bacterium]